MKQHHAYSKDEHPKQRKSRWSEQKMKPKSMNSKLTDYHSLIEQVKQDSFGSVSSNKCLQQERNEVEKRKVESVDAVEYYHDTPQNYENDTFFCNKYNDTNTCNVAAVVKESTESKNTANWNQSCAYSNLPVQLFNFLQDSPDAQQQFNPLPNENEYKHNGEGRWPHDVGKQKSLPETWSSPSHRTMQLQQRTKHRIVPYHISQRYSPRMEASNHKPLQRQPYEVSFETRYQASAPLLGTKHGLRTPLLETPYQEPRFLLGSPFPSQRPMVGNPFPCQRLAPSIPYPRQRLMPRTPLLHQRLMPGIPFPHERTLLRDPFHQTKPLSQTSHQQSRTLLETPLLPYGPLHTKITNIQVAQVGNVSADKRNEVNLKEALNQLNTLKKQPKFVAVGDRYAISDLSKLYKKAECFISHNHKVHQCEYFYRDKTSGYYIDIKQLHHGIMAKYVKDLHGDPRSPINGQLHGLFFNVKVDPYTCQPPQYSLFGERRLVIPVGELIRQASNLYFTDFYCISRCHYVTLVMTKPSSPADTFCEKNLLKIDKSNNCFFQANYSEQQDIFLFVPVRPIVEVFYTEDINIAKVVQAGARFTDVNMVGQRLGGTVGLSKNMSCKICNME